MTDSPETTDPRRRLADLTDAVIDHLTFQRTEGLLHLEMEPEAAAGRINGNEPKAAASGMETVAGQVAACMLCPLCETRKNPVPGQGAAQPELVFVGEGPGAEEDRQGLAFVGEAGQVLTRMITRMGFSREDVWIGNIVKCRPPGNRKPMPDEMQACRPYLEAQLQSLKPKVIVCLGATAIEGLLGLKGITRLRGTWQRFGNIDVMPTYHPAYLLRSQGDEKMQLYWDVWDDLVKVLEKLGRRAPEA